MIKNVTILELNKSTLRSSVRGTNRGAHSHFHAS